MKSLFVRMFLSFCAAAAIAVFVLVAGFVVNNPDQIRFAWPRVGRGAIVSAGRLAIAAYERGGRPELAAYLASLSGDTGIRGVLFDSASRPLSGIGLASGAPAEMAFQSEEQLVFRMRERVAAVRLRGGRGDSYVFATRVPRREANLFWPRTYIVAFVIAGAFLCYLLARHVTAPVAQLRSATSRFSGGDLAARVTAAEVLGRTDEIGGLARDFNQMATRIQYLLKSQQRLIADVSHELRSPITRLSLALGLMRRNNDADPGASLARMEREVERLNALISQLLMLSRLEAEHKPAMERLDLRALVQEIASDADFEATSKDRSVRLVEGAACSVRGARDLLRSAVENVVRNAVKYTKPDTQVAIRLECPNGKRTATLVVTDEGPGVPPDALQYMFEPFYRVDEARDRRSGGAGLGLAIARQIVALHGGSIGAVNREGGGLEMRITLPVEPAA